MQSSIRTGIIGLGKMGLLHGALLRQLPQVKLVAIADTSRLVLKAFKSVMPDVIFFHSYEKMLDTVDLDAVVISTPPFSHVPIAELAISKSLQVFVEKPLCVTYEQGLQLAEVIRRKKGTTMVGYCSRFMPSFTKMKKVVDSGELGKIFSVSAENYSSDVLKRKAGWRFSKKISGGGVVIDFTVHILDLLVMLFGNVKSVEARTEKIYSDDVEDSVEASIEFEKDIKGSVHSSWSSPEHRKFYMKIEISGEKGRLVATDQTLSITMEDGHGRVPRNQEYFQPDLYEGCFFDIAGPAYSLQMKKFVDSIHNKQPYECDFFSSLYVQKIVDVIYQSAQEEKRILVE